MSQNYSTPPKSQGAGADEASSPNGDESGRKERVLHARIPESLDDAIRAAASELGMSVSNLVRNVLANTLEVVEAAALRVPQRAVAAAARAARPTARAESVAGAAGAAGGAGAEGAPGSAGPGAAGRAGATAAPSPEAAPPAAEPVVLGWQEAILNLNAVCDRCNAILARGTRAAIAVLDRPSAHRAIRCLACLEELTRDPAR